MFLSLLWNEIHVKCIRKKRGIVFKMMRWRSALKWIPNLYWTNQDIELTTSLHIYTSKFNMWRTKSVFKHDWWGRGWCGICALQCIFNMLHENRHQEVKNKISMENKSTRLPSLNPLLILWIHSRRGSIPPLWQPGNQIHYSLVRLCVYLLVV